MKTLVLHPQDSSTDFLKPIYHHQDDVTLVRKNISRDTLHELIYSHDRIVMLGHGSPNGLFNVANIGEGMYTIAHSTAKVLRGKQLIAIWCNANQFIEQHRLPALYSGMFISEVNEAKYCGVQSTQTLVDESNSTFAVLLGNVLGEVPDNLKDVHSLVGKSYADLGKVNEVAKYNSDRWYYKEKYEVNSLANI